MQTKYYLTFEQVGIIRRIPLKEQKVPLGDAGQCVRNLLQIIQYDEIFDSAAKDIANELRLNLRVSWKHIHPDSPGPEKAFINQFYTEVINRLKTKL